MPQPTLYHPLWKGAYPPSHLLRRGRCRRCCAVLVTRPERLTDACTACWNRPLQWTDAQMEALLMDILETEDEPEEKEPEPVKRPVLQRILQGWWSRTMRDETLEDPDDE